MKDELIEAQENYIKLLIEELEEVVPLAAIHGWRSSRFEKGVEARTKIKNLRCQIYQLNTYGENNPLGPQSIDHDKRLFDPK